MISLKPSSLGLCNLQDKRLWHSPGFDGTFLEEVVQFVDRDESTPIFIDSVPDGRMVCGQHINSEFNNRSETRVHITLAKYFSVQASSGADPVSCFFMAY